MEYVKKFVFEIKELIETEINKDDIEIYIADDLI